MFAIFGFLLLVVVFAPAPLLAVAVVVVRLRGAVRRKGAGALAARSWTAARNGVRRPVWPGLLAAAVGGAALTAALERGYLGAVADGPREGFDVVMLALVLGLFAVAGCAALTGLVAVAVGRARGFGAGTVAGLLALAAVVAGVAAAHLPLRSAYLAESDRFPVVPNLGEGDLLIPFDAFLWAAIWALPWPVLGAALGGRSQAAGQRSPASRDRWQFLLDLATADLPEHRAAWGVALRAELAAIDPPAERRRFALGGAWAALRSGPSHGTWVLAGGVAVVMAAGTFAASRWSLAHGRGGVLDFWMAAPSVLLLAVALAMAWRTGSFGSGMRAGALAGVAALVALLAVGIPEAVVWMDLRAGYLTTGDAVPPNWRSAVGDVLRPEFLAGMVIFWTTGTAGGAALGTALARLRGTAAPAPPGPVAPAPPIPPAPYAPATPAPPGPVAPQQPPPRP